MTMCVRVAVLFMMVVGLPMASSSVSEKPHMRSEKPHHAGPPTGYGDHVAAEVHAHGHSVLLDRSEAGEAAERPTSDPCRYLGCQTDKCEWTSGETVAKVARMKACKNAKVLNNNVTTIDTLTGCVQLTRSKKEANECGQHFEMNMETNECSCVPVGEECQEKDHAKVCRYELLRYSAPGSALQEGEAHRPDDPCRELGCNRHKCEWGTGEVIRKVAGKRACKNAQILLPDAPIDSLTKCLRAVRGAVGQAAGCGDEHFEMNVETNDCSCLLKGDECEEKSHDKVCRYQMIHAKGSA